MKVTISDVARLAGVSTATVSHTINNTRYVSGDTKEKVYQAIRQLGYTPDASARSFRTGKKRTIGFIVPDISNKFFGTIIESAENVLSAEGYHLIIANTKENMEREENTIRLLTAGLVDGLLIASTIDDFARFDSLIPAGFPVVLVDRTFDSQKYSSVSVSNFQPIYRSVCRLAGKGMEENIHYVKAGVGGTPSELGMLRYHRDVCRDGAVEPDIVVVEFAVNDLGDETQGECYDSLVRMILGAKNAPAVILLTVFTVYPLGYLIYRSLYGGNLITKDPKFVGFDNYLNLLESKDFHQVFGNYRSLYNGSGRCDCGLAEFEKEPPFERDCTDLYFYAAYYFHGIRIDAVFVADGFQIRAFERAVERAGL